MKSERSREQYKQGQQTSNGKKQLVSIDKEYAQMVLDATYLHAESLRLKKLIDQSLDNRDREAFMKYTEAYNQIIS